MKRSTRLKRVQVEIYPFAKTRKQLTLSPPRRHQASRFSVDCRWQNRLFSDLVEICYGAKLMFFLDVRGLHFVAFRAISQPWGVSFEVALPVSLGLVVVFGRLWAPIPFFVSVFLHAIDWGGTVIASPPGLRLSFQALVVVALLILLCIMVFSPSRSALLWLPLSQLVLASLVSIILK